MRHVKLAPRVKILYVMMVSLSAAVAGSPSYKDLSGALADLGKFYAKNGQRTPLPVDVRDSILAQIAAAEEEVRALEGAKK